MTFKLRVLREKQTELQFEETRLRRTIEQIYERSLSWHRGPVERDTNAERMVFTRMEKVQRELESLAKRIQTEEQKGE